MCTRIQNNLYSLQRKREKYYPKGYVATPHLYLYTAFEHILAEGGLIDTIHEAICNNNNRSIYVCLAEKELTDESPRLTSSQFRTLFTTAMFTWSKRIVEGYKAVVVQEYFERILRPNCPEIHAVFRLPGLAELAA